jgi:hypothetical protein
MLWGAGGYLLGVLLAVVLVLSFSDNRHDRELEAAMTGFFAGGPLLALIGLLFGLFRRPKSGLPADRSGPPDPKAPPP